MLIEQKNVLDEDMLSVLVNHYLQIKSVRVRYIFTIVIACLIILLSFSFFIVSDYITGTAFCLIGIAFLLFDLFGYKKMIQKNFRKLNKPMLGQESEVKITDESIFLSSALGKSEYNWNAVNEIWQSGKYVALSFSNNMTVLMLLEKLSEEQKDWLLNEKAKAIGSNN